MLGNDIVDFRSDDNKHYDSRFIHRILNTQEQDYLSQSSHPSLFLWSLWAAKEASYKALQRLQPELTFSPIKIELNTETLQQLLTAQSNESLYGTACHSQQTIKLKFNWPETTVVHCLACRDIYQWANIDYKVACLSNLDSYKKQSQAVRTLARELLKSHQINADIVRPVLSMKAYTKPGPPILVDRATGHTLPHLISLSHDHNYLAVALTK